jgi:hypothetical protein
LSRQQLSQMIVARREVTRSDPHRIQENHMFESFKSSARATGLAGTALALVGTALMPLQANAQAVVPTSAVNASTVEATPVRVDATAAQMVVRDPATGALRAPTAEEAHAMSSRSPSALRRTASATMPKVHVSGARGARLHDEFMSYSVVVRQADGSLAEQCFSSKAEADAALKSSPVARAATPPTE